MVGMKVFLYLLFRFTPDFAVFSESEENNEKITGKKNKAKDVFK